MDENLEQTIAALEIAKAMTQERLLKFPNYGPYIHAKEQIDFIEEILRIKTRPCEREANKIDIALMAIKELDATEPEYSDALCQLSFHFKKLHASKIRKL